MIMKDMKQFGAKLGNQANNRATPIQVDAAAIRELAQLLDETGLGEIEVEQAGRRVRVSMRAAAAPTAPVQAVAAPFQSHLPAESAEAPKAGPGEGAVTSPMVGTVYVSPEPGKPPFVKPGDSVREGETLLIIEAMKTMNPIAAPRTGVVKEICVRDAQPVEFGQVLIFLGGN